MGSPPPEIRLAGSDVGMWIADTNLRKTVKKTNPQYKEMPT